MSILRIKNADGTWSDIPAIKGADGKDGAIQYTAGANIKIENNIISAEIPEATDVEPDLYKLAERTTVYKTKKQSYTNLTDYKFGTPRIQMGWYLNGRFVTEDSLYLKTERITDDNVCSIVKFELTSPVDKRVKIEIGMNVGGFPANVNQIGILLSGPEPNLDCTESEIRGGAYLRFLESQLDPSEYEDGITPSVSVGWDIDLTANQTTTLHVKFVKANTGGLPARGWVLIPLEYLPGVETNNRLMTATDVYNMIQDEVTNVIEGDY